MKIITVDNYDRETVSHKLVIPYIQSPEIAEQIAKLLNDDGGPEPSVWHRVVPDDHKLYVFEP